MPTLSQHVIAGERGLDRVVLWAHSCPPWLGRLLTCSPPQKARQSNSSIAKLEHALAVGGTPRDLGVANRDTWTVIGVDADGCRQLAGRANQAHVPATYVRDHPELAYATTVYGAQGETVDQAQVDRRDHWCSRGVRRHGPRRKERRVAAAEASLDTPRASSRMTPSSPTAPPPEATPAVCLAVIGGPVAVASSTRAGSYDRHDAPQLLALRRAASASAWRVLHASQRIRLVRLLRGVRR